MGFGSIVDGLFKIGANALEYDTQRKTDQANKEELARSAFLEDANAVDSLSRGSFAAGLIRRKASQAVQEQRLAFAVSGVDSGYGTPGDLSVATTANSEADVQQYLNNAMRESWGHSEVGRKYRKQRDVLISKSENADIAYHVSQFGGVFSVAADALGSAGGF